MNTPPLIHSIYKSDEYQDYSIFLNEWHDRAETQRACLACNDCPTHPWMGISQFTSGTPGTHCGELIRFNDLPGNVQQHVSARLS